MDDDWQHQIVSHRVPVTRISPFFVTLISFLLILVTFSTCIMCVTYVRRKMRKKQNSSLFCRSETSETLIESTLINNNDAAPTINYSAIDV